jgi:hypothetical protein
MFRLSSYNKTFILLSTSLCSVTTPIGCILSGYLLDLIGPKRTLITEISLILDWLLISTSSADEMIYIGRLLVGLGWIWHGRCPSWGIYVGFSEETLAKYGYGCHFEHPADHGTVGTRSSRSNTNVTCCKLSAVSDSAANYQACSIQICTQPRQRLATPRLQLPTVSGPWVNIRPWLLLRTTL